MEDVEQDSGSTELPGVESAMRMEGGRASLTAEAFDASPLTQHEMAQCLED